MINFKKICNWFTTKSKPIFVHEARWNKIRKIPMEEKFDFISEVYFKVQKFYLNLNLIESKDFGDIGGKLIFHCNHGVRLEKDRYNFKDGGGAVVRRFYVNNIEMLTIHYGAFVDEHEYHFDKDKYYDEFNEIMTNCYNDADMLLGEVEDYIGSKLRNKV